MLKTARSTHEFLLRAEAAQRHPGSCVLRGQRVAGGADRYAGVSVLSHRRMGGALDRGRGSARVPLRDDVLLVLRMDAARHPA